MPHIRMNLYVYLYIFQTLINADQFYREVNERYGNVQCTAQYGTLHGDCHFIEGL